MSGRIVRLSSIFLIVFRPTDFFLRREEFRVDVTAVYRLCSLFSFFVSTWIYLGRLIAGWNYLLWQWMVLSKQRVIILLSHKWDLKGLSYLCFPCPLHRGRKRCCPLGGACLFPAPGGEGDLLGGAPQSPWYPEGPSCCVAAFQRPWRMESAVLCGHLAQTKLGGGGGSSIRIASCSPSSGCVPLLCYCLMPLPNFLAVIFHGMLFSPHFRPCSSSTREPLLSWSAVSECSERHCGSCLCLKLCLGTICVASTLWAAEL